MASDLILYTHPQSRGCMARWLLEEAGVVYQTRHLSYGAEMKSPEYLRIHPLGKVPALWHDGKVITETAAICCYVADVFPASNLAPPDDKLHEYYSWMFFCAGPIEQAMGDKARKLEPLDQHKPMLGYSDYESLKRVLDQCCAEGPYILGDNFTAVDVYLGSHIGWGMQFGLIEATPVLETYWKRLQDRPAYKAACRKDETALQELKSGN